MKVRGRRRADGRLQAFCRFLSVRLQNKSVLVVLSRRETYVSRSDSSINCIDSSPEAFPEFRSPEPINDRPTTRPDFRPPRCGSGTCVLRDADSMHAARRMEPSRCPHPWRYDTHDRCARGSCISYNVLCVMYPVSALAVHTALAAAVRLCAGLGCNAYIHILCGTRTKRRRSFCGLECAHVVRSARRRQLLRRRRERPQHEGISLPSPLPLLSPPPIFSLRDHISREESFMTLGAVLVVL